jgi:hypothetical protein
VVVLVVLLAVVAVLGVLGTVTRCRRPARREAAEPGVDLPVADGDLWNAGAIGSATGHAWMAGDHAARARAVTDAARRHR